MMSPHSIVIPVHNGARYLRAALASIGALQAAVPPEVIVVDDGSSDASARIAEDWGAHTLRQPTRGGAAAARNRGAAAASGEWLHFLDADDLYAPDRLTAMEAAAGTADLVVGQIVYLLSPDLPAEQAARVQRPPGAIPGWYPGGVMVRRQRFLDSGGFDHTLAAGEFIDWVLRLREAGCHIAQTAAQVAERRVHADNLGKASREDFGASYLRIIHAARQRARQAPR